MKAFTKFHTLTGLLTGLFLTAVTVAGATDLAPSLSIVQAGFTKKFALSAQGLGGGDASVTIEDQNGLVLLKENIANADSYSKIFNMENLPAGRYLVTLHTFSREIYQPIALEENGVKVDISQRSERFIPIIDLRDRVLGLSYLNTERTNVKVSILDSDGKTVHQDNVDDGLTVERLYNLQQLPTGLYTLRVQTPRRTWYKDVVLK